MVIYYDAFLINKMWHLKLYSQIYMKVGGGRNKYFINCFKFGKVNKYSEYI